MDNFTVAFCIATCITIYAIFNIVLKFEQRRHIRHHASKLTGPPTLPFIGNAHLFIGSTEDTLNTFVQFGTVYPTPYRIWIGNHVIFVINTPEQMKVVLLSPKSIDKGPFYDFARPWIGTGLVTADATKWRAHRKLMQPTFSLTILQSFVGTFSARSEMMAEEMACNLDGPEFDIYDYTSKCMLRTICETTMGVKLELQTDSNFCYAEAVETVIASLCRRIVSPWLHPNFIFNFTHLGRTQRKNIKFLHTFTDNVIRMKKKKLLEENSPPSVADNGEDNSNQVPRRKILLDHLIEVSNSGETLSDESLRDEVNTVIAAGSDATAVISSYVMLMLAFHPEVQENAYQELCKIFEDSHAENLRFTPDDLNRMTYLERVIKETMRLFPIAPLLTRLVTKDLDIGEHKFPEGSLLALSIMDLHRNEKYWPDPLKFDPDRFLPEEVRKRDLYAYLPFSGGPRACLGSKYAMMSMKILLATVLKKYILKKDTIIPVKDLRVKWEFVLRPVNPITLRIEKRS